MFQDLFFCFFLTFLGDFTPDRLDSRSLQTPWERKNRVLLEEYYIFNVAIPLKMAYAYHAYWNSHRHVLAIRVSQDAGPS